MIDTAEGVEGEARRTGGLFLRRRGRRGGKKNRRNISPKTPETMKLMKNKVACRISTREVGRPKEVFWASTLVIRELMAQ